MNLIKERSPELSPNIPRPFLPPPRSLLPPCPPLSSQNPPLTAATGYNTRDGCPDWLCPCLDVTTWPHFGPTTQDLLTGLSITPDLIPEPWT